MWSYSYYQTTLKSHAFRRSLCVLNTAWLCVDPFASSPTKYITHRPVAFLQWTLLFSHPSEKFFSISKQQQPLQHIYSILLLLVVWKLLIQFNQGSNKQFSQWVRVFIPFFQWVYQLSVIWKHIVIKVMTGTENYFRLTRLCLQRAVLQLSVLSNDEPPIAPNVFAAGAWALARMWAHVLWKSLQLGTCRKEWMLALRLYVILSDKL